MTDDEWREECNYIDRVAVMKGKTGEFNHDPACFLRYCEMQQRQAERDGRFDSAEYIGHVIDDMRGKTT